MSLVETNVLDVAKIQYRYKCKAYMNLFLAMIAVQAIALFFSLGGVGAMGTSVGNIAIRFKYYSSDIIIVFTAFWAFVVAIIITTKEYRDFDYAFVANRQSSNLANIAFLITASIFGGLTAILGGIVLRVIVYFSLGSESVAVENFFVTASELLIAINVTVMYLILLSAIGYIMGVLVQLSKAFIILLPGLFFGSMVVALRSGHASIVVDTMSFFLDETSFILLAAKIILVAGVLFFGATMLSGRLEVRT